MFDVVCVGNALVDITLEVPDSFLLGANLKKGTMSLVDDVSQKFLLSSISGIASNLSPGGSSSNVARGISCLGGKSCFIGKVGVDANGSFFENALNDSGVVAKLARSVDLITGSAITFVTSEGERTFSTYLGAASSLSKADLAEVPKAKFVHVEAYLLEDPVIREHVLDFVMRAKSSGSLVSLDLSDPLLVQRIKPVLSDFLSEVDVVFANESEAKEFCGEDVFGAARILSNFCEIAVVKLGKEGSLIVSDNIQERVTPEVVKPVNSNGAGDAYAAGFLFGLSLNLDLKKCGELGSFLARETVLVEGSAVSSDLKEKALKYLD